MDEKHANTGQTNRDLCAKVCSTQAGAHAADRQEATSAGLKRAQTTVLKKEVQNRDTAKR
jgi:hypothetical protein